MLFLKTVNLVLRFFLELGVLLSLGYWGFNIQSGVIVRWLAGIGAPLLAAFVWGTFGSPQATIPLTGSLHLLLEFVVFGAGVAALFAAGRSNEAWVFALIIVINRILLFIWKQ